MCGFFTLFAWLQSATDVHHIRTKTRSPKLEHQNSNAKTRTPKLKRRNSNAKSRTTEIQPDEISTDEIRKARLRTTDKTNKTRKYTSSKLCSFFFGVYSYPPANNDSELVRVWSAEKKCLFLFTSNAFIYFKLFSVRKPDVTCPTCRELFLTVSR